jgi:hypothetical protein
LSSHFAFCFRSGALRRSRVADDPSPRQPLEQFSSPRLDFCLFIAHLSSLSVERLHRDHPVSLRSLIVAARREYSRLAFCASSVCSRRAIVRQNDPFIDVFVAVAL